MIKESLAAPEISQAQEIIKPDIDPTMTLSLKTVLDAFPPVESNEMHKPKVRILSHYFWWPSELDLSKFDITNPDTWKIVSPELKPEDIATKEHQVKELISRVSTSCILAKQLVSRGYDVEIVNACADTDAFGGALPSTVIATLVEQFQKNFQPEVPLTLRHMRYGYSTIEEMQAGMFGGQDLAGVVSVTSAYHVPRTRLYFQIIPEQMRKPLVGKPAFVLGNPIVKEQTAVGTKYSNLGLFTSYDQTIIPEDIRNLLQAAAVSMEQDKKERELDELLIILASFLHNFALDYLSAVTRRQIPFLKAFPEVLRLRNVEEILNMLKELTQTKQTFEANKPSSEG